MQPWQELLQKWKTRDPRIRARMEITGDGLTLGAGTILAKIVQDRSGGSSLTLNDEPRVMALLATAYERPIGRHVLTKLVACVN